MGQKYNKFNHGMTSIKSRRPLLHCPTSIIQTLSNTYFFYQFYLINLIINHVFLITPLLIINIKLNYISFIFIYILIRYIVEFANFIIHFGFLDCLTAVSCVSCCSEHKQWITSVLLYNHFHFINHFLSIFYSNNFRYKLYNICWLNYNRYLIATVNILYCCQIGLDFAPGVIEFINYDR